jgi:hypothetical protein
MHSPSVTSATLLPATTGRGVWGGDSISRAGTTRNAKRVDLLLSYSGLVLLKEILQDIYCSEGQSLKFEKFVLKDIRISHRKQCTL